MWAYQSQTDRERTFKVAIVTASRLAQLGKNLTTFHLEGDFECTAAILLPDPRLEVGAGTLKCSTATESFLSHTISS